MTEDKVACQVTVEPIDERSATMICDLLEAVESTDRLSGWEIGLLDRLNFEKRMQNRALSDTQKACLEKIWAKVFP